MTRFDQLMNEGKELEAKKLYRRAADRCLSKAKVKVTESYL
ncbi:hypothetical protein L3033_004179 [Providencia stuartii]